MKDKLAKYIEDNLIIEDYEYGLFKSAVLGRKNALYSEDVETSSVSEYIDKNKKEDNFQKLLFKYIDDRNLKDSDVYNKVHIDRRLFSKIRNDNYHPSKDTIILLGLSLKLNIDEFIDLLDSASYSLPKNNHFDLIIRFCFVENIYDLKDVNDLLAMYGCKQFNY